MRQILFFLIFISAQAKATLNNDVVVGKYYTLTTYSKNESGQWHLFSRKSLLSGKKECTKELEANIGGDAVETQILHALAGFLSLCVSGCTLGDYKDSNEEAVESFMLTDCKKRYVYEPATGNWSNLGAN